MLRACSRCGRVHNDSYNCYAGRLPLTNEQALRNKNAWHKKSEDIRARSSYLCAVCLDNGDYHIKPVEIHHIIKLRDYPKGLLDDSNLICLCIYHHKQADRGEIDPDYLRSLADKRDGVGLMNDKATPPGGLGVD